MKRLYVDMDGTLAVFNNQIESEEVLWQEGYYRNLPPLPNVVEAVRLLASREDMEVFILSAVLSSPYAEREKNEWLNEYLPEIDHEHRTFVPCGEDKGKYIGRILGDDDLLLDDYSKNLHSWCPPGRAVELMNDINGNFGTWQGERVHHFGSPEHIANKLLEALGIEDRIFTIKNICERPVPIGRIEYLHTDGRVRESVEYTRPYMLIKDIREENYYGVPMKLVLYADKEGNTIERSFINELDPPINWSSIPNPYLSANIVLSSDRGQLTADSADGNSHETAQTLCVDEDDFEL